MSTTLSTKDRRAQVADLLARRATREQMAKALGVTLSTIARDVEAVRKLWLERTVRDYEVFYVEELAGLERIEIEAWAAWQASVRAASADPSKSPDPAFLRVILRAKVDKARLSGLYDRSDDALERAVAAGVAAGKALSDAQKEIDEMSDADVVDAFFSRVVTVRALEDEDERG